MLKLQYHSAISQISEAQWDALLGPDPEPYLRWAFLDALEQTGCVKPEVGWEPCHLALYRGEHLIGAAPAYIKSNSEGEFVFDHSWAEFAQGRLGIDYYPKLLLAVPFTPATGRRLLVAAGEVKTDVRAALLAGALELCDKLNLSSAHVLFSGGDEIEAYEQLPLLQRHGVQFHWHNAGYRTFDDFLLRFSSKRRNQIKRERRQVAELGLSIDVVEGSELRPELIDAVYEFYQNTVSRHFYGRQYLSRAFFEQICARMPEQLLVVLARSSTHASPVAGAFNLVGGGVMFGRYWGALEEHSNLHFELCYYRGVEESIARGLSRFEPGAGGEHKISRGFEPTVTRSYHAIKDRRLQAVVSDFLARERAGIAQYIAEQSNLLRSQTHPAV